MLPFFPLALLFACSGAPTQVRAVPTWPSPVYDELEELMMQYTGYRRRGFVDGVNPCSFSAGGSIGRRAAAEWIRTAYHDMATADVATGAGGIDASIAFEMDRGENTGKGILDTIGFLQISYSARASMADLIALGVHTSVRSCGGPFIPYRAGRIDALAAGPYGVPKPEDSITTLADHFQRAGFNSQDMIGLVACGHTLGGVHSEDFPDIVLNGSRPGNTADFDSTPASRFDNRVVVEYLDNNSSSPLLHGPERTNSDALVFGSDGNITMKAMRDPLAFEERCKTLFERMINTVPKEVILTDPIIPYEVKPLVVRLTIDGNSTLSFAGEIRVRTTVRRRTDISKVQILFASRDSQRCNYGDKSCTIETTQPAFQYGTGYSIDENFSWFTFSTKVPSSSAVASYRVAITLVDGTVEIHDNNQDDFPVQNLVFFQPSESCTKPIITPSTPVNTTVVAAVHISRLTFPDPILRVTAQYERGVVGFPELRSFDVSMVPWIDGARVAIPNEYVWYTGTYSLLLNANPRFDILSGSGKDLQADEFINAFTIKKCT